MKIQAVTPIVGIVSGTLICVMALISADKLSDSQFSGAFSGGGVTAIAGAYGLARTGKDD